MSVRCEPDTARFSKVIAIPNAPATFRPKGAPSRQESGRQYDRFRGSARERGYTTRWDKASKGFLNLHPLCCGCEAVDALAAAEVTDHIIPFKGDNKLKWDRDNWQPCCKWHHNVVKQRLDQMFEAGQIGVDQLRLDSQTAIRLTRELGGAGQKSTGPAIGTGG